MPLRQFEMYGDDAVTEALKGMVPAHQNATKRLHAAMPSLYSAAERRLQALVTDAVLVLW